MRSFAACLSVGLILLGPASLSARAEAPPPPKEDPPAATPAAAEAGEAPPSRDARPAPRNVSPTQIFAAAEEAWTAGDSEGLAALVDTSVVRIALKPGVPPTAAPTRGAAAFLFQDQLRLVKTQSFQIQRIAIAKNSASASALWVGDWGGRLGVRRVKVTFTAAPSGGRWLLREVRARN